MDPDTQNPSSVASGIKRRGFASMSSEKRRIVASAGGKVAHSKGRAHVFTPEEAQAAGRKGGSAVSQDAEHMARIGRTGGTNRWARERGTEELGEPPTTELPETGER